MDTTANPTGNQPAGAAAGAAQAPASKLPASQAGPDKVHMHPMVFESKYFIAGLMFGFVLGAALGIYLYLEGKINALAIAGIAILGAILFGAVGMVIPARKVVAKSYDGRTEYHYC